MNAPLRCDYPPELPVSQNRERIVETIRRAPVVIVCGDTGSGKTTQLPKMALEAGCGRKGRIGVTQPRRLAAVSMAQRVAEECGSPLGAGVGVHVRFDERCSEDTVIKFMTDGILLAELQHDREWKQYDAIIIDEAHERSLNIDFLLGCLKRLRTTRPDLKIIISSATLDAERFAAFFDEAPVIQVQGRLFPIEDHYLPPEKEDMELRDQVAHGLDYLQREHGLVDTLVFLPGEREILDAQKRVEGLLRDRAEVIPLFARLSMEEQQRAFRTGDRPRVILATNVAETSITLPGIRAVIDSGVVRMHRYHPHSQIQRLQTEQVSQASAKQRRGRCGRTGPGICVRLYARESLEQAPAYSDPEILRSSLAEVILRMAVQGLPPIQDFPFLDPPKGGLIAEGYRSLVEVGAMTRQRRLTKLGRKLASFPLEPRLARMLVQAEREKVLPQVLVLTAFLSIQDPRQRPRDAQELADQAHARWKDAQSDFIRILNLWNGIQTHRTEHPGRGALRRFCRKNFLHPIRIQEWMNLVKELARNARAHRWSLPKQIGILDLEDRDGIHRSLLAGVPGRIGLREENNVFRSPKGQSFYVFPGSGLFKKPPRWVMAFSLVETQRLFARDCAQIRPEWLEEIAPHLCKQQLENPHWNEKRGFVEASERIVLGQLCVVPPRPVHYGRFYAAEAREIFLEDGLLPAALQLRHPSLNEYRRFLKSLVRWEHKLRRPGYFTESSVLLNHLRTVVPGTLHTARDFDRWCKEGGGHWVPRPEQVMEGLTDASAYPDRLDVNGIDVRCIYRFVPDEPEKDGVTFSVRERDLAQLPEALLEWTIPAWVEEKVRLLLRTLPKNLRTACQPHQKTASDFLIWAEEEGFFYSHSMLDALAAFLRVRLDEILAAPDFEPERLPAMLQSKLRVVDEKGKPLHEGLAFPGAAVLASSKRKPSGTRSPWSVTPSLEWPGVELPETVDWQGRTQYPALRSGDEGVDVELYATPEEAAWSHRDGLVQLFAAKCPQQLTRLQKTIPLPTGVQLELAALRSENWDAMQEVISGIVADSLFQGRNMIRDAETFAAAAEHTRGQLFGMADQRATDLYQVFEARSRLLALREGAHWIPVDLAEDLDAEWSRLFAMGWMRRREGWQRLPRYLAAIEKRLERMQRDHAKDRRKLEPLLPLQGALQQAWSDWHPALRQEAILLLQEWRIATFAPELRPHEKVSEKRIRAWLNQTGIST